MPTQQQPQLAPQQQPQLWLGGSFNPVHLGHLQLARSLAQGLGAQTWLLPSGQSAFGKSLATAEQRRAMLDSALADFPSLQLDCRELNRQGISYSIDTLRQIRQEYGAAAHLSFVLGEDALAQLHRWKDCQQLLSQAHLLVLLREHGNSVVGAESAPPAQPVGGVMPPDQALARLARLPQSVQELLKPQLTDAAGWRNKQHGLVMFWHNPLVLVSSTQVRRLAIKQDWQALAGLVPASVVHYLREVQPYSLNTQL